MQIQQIRNATMKIKYGNITFLLDSWLQDKGTGFSARAKRPEANGIKGLLNDLPFKTEEILNKVDYLLVTHNHPDHFTEKYLPKNIKFLVANEIDQKDIKELGFKNVSVIGKGKDELIDIQIKKTPAKHGNNEEIALKIGDGSGYFLTGEDKSLNIAGDTVFNNDIKEILEKEKPNIIILNSDGAEMPGARLIMDLNEAKKVADLCPDSTIILTHFDSVNHGMFSSKEAQEFVKANHLSNALVPKNGEILKFD